VATAGDVESSACGGQAGLFAAGDPLLPAFNPQGATYNSHS
jgi:hypothetical protein